MEAETIELKVEVTGLDEAQKKISDFMNHPDVKRYEALMGLTPPIWTNTQNLIDKIEEEFQRGDEKSNQDKELIINLVNGDMILKNQDVQDVIRLCQVLGLAVPTCEEPRMHFEL